MTAAIQLESLTERLNDALPQTQCTRCGYPDCHAYAAAMAAGNADINQCPPGGAEGIQRLAALTGRSARALNPDNGTEGPRAVAVIDEAWCIGCTLCIKACPVDSIVGASKLMHSVVEPLCTGCELCIPVCPVDCISMVPVTGERTGWQAWTADDAQQARERYHARTVRLDRDQRENDERLAAKAQSKLADLASHSRITDPQVLAAKQAVIAAALERARSRPRPQLPTLPGPRTGPTLLQDAADEV